MFDRPSIWKWNQEMDYREKFITGTLVEKDSDLEENLKVTIRKTSDFITLYILRENYMVDGTSPKIKEYSLDKNGQIKYKENMDKEDYKVYVQWQDEIENGVKKLNQMYAKLYE